MFKSHTPTKMYISKIWPKQEIIGLKDYEYT